MMQEKILKKYCCLILILFLKCPTSWAQIFNDQYFEDTKWVSKSKDSSFFKADTVQLVKTIDDTYFINGQGMDIPEFFNTDFVQLEFHKNRKLKLSTFFLKDWVIGTFGSDYKWQYIKSTNFLNLYFNDTLIMSFIPILNSVKKILIPSSYNGKPDIETIEISLVRKYCIFYNIENR